MSLFQFIATHHSVLSLCCYKTHRTGRKNTFLFLFVTGATLALAMLVATHFPNKPITAWAYSTAATLLLVSPATCLAKFLYRPMTDNLAKITPNSMPLDLRIEEVLQAICITALLIWAATDVQAAQAFSVSLYTLVTQYVTEIPSLVYQYLFCRVCCSCCLPKQRDAIFISETLLEEGEHPPKGEEIMR